MPYFYDPTKDQDQNPANVQITGAAPTANAQGQVDQGNQDPANKPLKTGSGFTDINKYLQANDPSQIQGQVNGKVSDQVGQAKQSQSDVANQLTSGVQQANQTPSRSDVQQAIAKPETANKQQFQGWENQTYQGPKSLAENSGAFNQYWNGTNQAQTQAQLLGSNTGRYTLLDSYFGQAQGGQPYTSGQSHLDSLLLSNAQGFDPNQYRQQAQKLATEGKQGIQNIQNQIGSQIGKVDQSREGVRSAIGIDANGKAIVGAGQGAIGQAVDQSAQNVGNKNAIRNNQFAGLFQDLNSGKATPEELQSLGIAPGTNTYDLNLAAFLSPGQQLGQSQMSPQDRARIQALSDLAGSTNTFTPEAQADPAYFQFDNPTFQQYLSGRQSVAAQNAKSSAAAAAQAAADEAERQRLINSQPGAPSKISDGNYSYGGKRG